MSGTVSAWQQGAFVTPVNGGSGDASVVLGNDNALRLKFNAHDADSTIHVQSSILASRPAAGTAGRFWITTDGLRAYLDSGSVWNELAYVSTAATELDLGTTILATSLGADLIISGSVTGDFCVRVNAKKLMWSVDNGASAGMKLTSLGLFVSGPVQKASGTTASVANTTSSASILVAAGVADGAYLVTASQTGTAANKVIGLYTLASGAASLSSIAATGGLTLLLFNQDVELTNNTGGAATFAWAYLRLT